MADAPTIDVDQIPAGRELDALVAETADGFSGRYGVPAWDKAHGANSTVPEYSTGIAAAWPLAERFQMSLYHPDDEEWGHDGEWGAFSNLAKCWAYGPTAPLAVCRCAFKAARLLGP